MSTSSSLTNLSEDEIPLKDPFQINKNRNQVLVVDGLNPRPHKRVKFHNDSISMANVNELIECDDNKTNSNQLEHKMELVRPTASECHRIYESLVTAHGEKPERPKVLNEPTEETTNWGASCGQVQDILDGLIRTILSQHTTQSNSIRSKKALDEKFGRGNYEAIRQSSVQIIGQVIRSAGVGLSHKKSVAIHQILNQIYQNVDSGLCLDFIRDLNDSEAMEILTSFKGVGVKTASCVLLFCLGRNFFPVDTHVFKITKALGWIPENSTRENGFQHLNATVPNELKYPLHILLIKHSQQCLVCKQRFKKPSDNSNSKKTKSSEKKIVHSKCPLDQFLVTSY